MIYPAMNRARFAAGSNSWESGGLIRLAGNGEARGTQTLAFDPATGRA